MKIKLLLLFIVTVVAFCIATTKVSAQTLPVGCKGDYNSSGTVDIADFQTLAQNYKKTGINCSLDITGGDCLLNLADFQAFAQIYKVTNACVSTTSNTFTLKDYFGVSHPNQIVDFDVTGTINPQNSYLVDSNNSEVAYQLLSNNKLSVETDLPINSTKTYTVKPGRAPAAVSNAVTLLTTQNYYEVTNGLTGVRVWQPDNKSRSITISSVNVINNVATFVTSTDHDLQTATADPNFGTADLDVTINSVSGCTYLNGQVFKIQPVGGSTNPDARQFKANVSGANCSGLGGTATLKETRLAPIQGIKYKDGTWTSLGPNYMKSAYRDLNLALNALNVSAKIIENGPLKVVIEVTYDYNRPAYVYGNVANVPAGPGHYISRIELQKDQPSISISEDTDMDLKYSLNVNSGLNADQARYRGHLADKPEYGHTATGGAIPMNGGAFSPSQDAFYELDYSVNHDSSYLTDSTHIKRVSAWDPWAANTGWYWQIYNKSAGTNANLFGIFAGPSSQAVGTHNSGPGIYTKTDGSTGVEFQANRRGPDNKFSTIVKDSWAIFVGTKGQDLKDPLTDQTIGLQMNIHAGINLNKMAQYNLTFPDPARGYGAIFIDKSSVQNMITKLRADTKGIYGGGYYGYLYNAEPYARSLIDMWHDTTGATTNIEVSAVLDKARTLLDGYVNHEGIYTTHYTYYEGAQVMNDQGVIIDQILANEYTSASQKDAVKAAAALYANITWDEDFAPLAQGQYFNLGTANMPVQMRSFRDFYALMLAEHPTMKDRAAAVETRAAADLNSIVNSYGAEFGSSNYMTASFVPVLHIFMQLQQLAKFNHTADPFTTYPKLAQFSEFLMQTQTPPDARYGNLRKKISIGDGTADSTEAFGELATAFRSVNPTLSARLMQSWIDGGKRHSGSTGGTSLLMIDENLPVQEQVLASANYPGWDSVFRYGWDTNNESALWFVNGDFYSDHRHTDYGSVVAYALKNPLILHWGSFYSPRIDGGYYQNIVLPESELTQTWNADNPPFTMGNINSWKNSTQTAYESFKASDFSQANFTSRNSSITWTRSVYSLHPNENYPVIIINDSYTGSGATVQKISTLNLMAQGAVSTPAGNITPPYRTSDTNGSQLASASQVIALPAGLNKFGFTGQWGIDWDLYTFSPDSQQALIGNWGNVWTSTAEAGQFQAATGTTYQEHQDILRVKGTGSNTYIILPYRKNEKPANLQVSQSGSQVIISSTGETTVIDPNYSSYKTSTKSILTAYNNNTALLDNLSIDGGPAELILTQGQVQITFHGANGIRHLKFPGSWSTSSGLTFVNGEYTFNYQGTNPQTITLSPV